MPTISIDLLHRIIYTTNNNTAVRNKQFDLPLQQQCEQVGQQKNSIIKTTASNGSLTLVWL